MGTAKKACEVVAEAERRLRELVGAAAAQGEYEDAVQITEWARTLGAIVHGPLDAVVESRVGSPASPTRAGAPRRAARRPVAGATGTRVRNGPPKKEEYPRFFRRDDSLVKVGWSRREKAEYEHKAPKRVASLLAGALARAAGNGKLIRMEDLFPLADPSDGSEIPTYQAYLCLAWLRETGLIEACGRQGYRCPNPKVLEAAVEATWNQTPAG